MQCPECQLLLAQRFDGEAPLNPEAEAHLSACPVCREWQSAARRLEDGLRLLVPPTPPTHLHGRIVAQVLTEQRAARRFRRRLQVGVALAASLLVAALAGYYWWPRTPETPLPQQPPNVATVPEPVTPLSSLREGVAQAGTVGAEMARRVKEETVEPIRMLWPDPMPTPGLPDAATLQHSVDPAAQGVRELTHGVTLASEPMTTGFRRWGDMVLKNLPPLEPPAKEGF